MSTNWKRATWGLVFVAIWVAASWAQQAPTAVMPGSTLKVEGTVTTLELAPPAGMPGLMMTSTDGKMYMIHLGPLNKMRPTGFNPKVGEKIAVTGTACCQAFGHVMIHSSAITLGGKTFQTPEAAMPADCCCLPRSQGA